MVMTQNDKLPFSEFLNPNLIITSKKSKLLKGKNRKELKALREQASVRVFNQTRDIF